MLTTRIIIEVSERQDSLWDCWEGLKMPADRIAGSGDDVDVRAIRKFLRAVMLLSGAVGLGLVWATGEMIVLVIG
ncbi:hypothetical protein [Methylobacterium durans]|uniref:Uncharacterized protein n=1 Tax=Methylobacterium durans TaxID=2202825 RepID=A0A2U8WCX0_9HYPH|nr:hypothetical protein [Methylobacterium durans]AWN44015.1 hypothetical protein DK389_30310 [Methylobacterium durans]